jgi:large subunit ribosomal protein L6
MSRVGNKPIPVPDDVKVSVDGRTVNVEGSKGKLSWTHRPEVAVKYDQDGKTITVQRSDDEALTRALHGTTRTLVANMIEGCRNGYQKSLEIYGVGYGVQVQGGKASVSVGYASPRVFDVPQGIEVTVQTPQARGDAEPARFTISGPDKQAVGEFAARLRMARPPEPYKGKGIRYAGEYVRRKVGKAFAGTGMGG